MAETVTLQGDKELIRKLERLDRAVQNKIARRASKTAMIPVRKKAQSNLLKNESIESGALKKSIGQKTVTRKDVTMTFVGPRVGNQYTKVWKGRIRKPWKYAHLVEFGSGPGGWRKNRVLPKPFAKPALLRQKESVVRDLGREMGRLIEIQATKA